MRFGLFLTASAAIAAFAGSAMAQDAPLPTAPGAAAASEAGGFVPPRPNAPIVSALPFGAPSPPLAAAGDVLETLSASGQFTILLQGIQRTNLTRVLQQNRNITLLAPTDTAFRSLPEDQLRELMSARNAETFQKVLTYHLINTVLTARDIRGAVGRVRTVEGSDLRVDGMAPPPTFDQARLVQPDVVATNGVIHVVDRLLIPPDVAERVAALATPSAGARGTNASSRTSPSH